ncbi:MAG: COG4223 family protein [Alphaproteobacteria bacterium]|jgi:hypothetical protein
MATEEKKPAAEKKEALPAEPKEKQPEKKQKKKIRKGRVVFFVFVLALAGVLSLPDVREGIYNEYASLTEDAVIPVETETSEDAENVPEEEISTRLEQLENARDFENAETVLATVEPQIRDGDAAILELANRYDQLLLRLNLLQERVDAFERAQAQEISSIRQSLPKPGLIEERLLALGAKEDVLVRQIADNGVRIEKVEKGKADASAVLALMERMETTERRIQASAVEKERAAALLLALYQLRETVMSGQPFLTEQQAVIALASSSPKLVETAQRLNTVAAGGVWTKAALEQSFYDYADKAALSVQLSPKTDWFHKALNSLRSLVVIRRIDAAPDDMSVDAVLARAQDAVEKGDIQTAVLQLKNLQGVPAETVKEWVAAAERFVLTQKTVSELIASTVGVLYADQLKGG